MVCFDRDEEIDIEKEEKNLKEIREKIKNSNQKAEVMDLEMIRTGIKDYLDDKGYGSCDKCDLILPIERGDNFFWIEDKEIWLCEGCYKNEKSN